MKSDHLILTDGNAGRQTRAKANFFERDWSPAWVNFLLQEVGGYTLASLECLSPQELSQYHFVYLPFSLAGALKEEHRPIFRDFVEAGGVLTVEGLVANFLDPSPVRFGSLEKPLKRITQVHNESCPPELAEILLQMPFRTRGWEVEGRKNGGEVILEMEDRPVLFKHRYGAGCLFVLGFDLGMLLTGLQQGTPVQGVCRLKKLFGTQTRVVEPEDLVLKASLLDNTIPWADLFERFLFKALTFDAPAPRWWYFPHGHTGAVISTHDEEAMGADPRLDEMCQAERERGVHGTVFVISDERLRERWQRNGRLKTLRKQGMEVGLHWNRFEKWRLKIRRFRFGMHEEPLTRQIHFLEQELGERVLVNRNHYLALGHSYGEHFERLQEHKLWWDSTYGPNQGGRGYLFGTGYPYVGLTGDGELSHVLELPFLTQELWGGADLEFLQKLIQESDENFHQCIVMNFHPHYSILREEGREAWLGSLELAQTRKQWIPTLGEFFEFFRKRTESRLQSQFQGNKGQAVAEAQGEGLAISFPSQISSGGKFAGAKVDGQDTPVHKVRNAWSVEVLIPLQRGRHEIQIVYEG